MLHAYIFNINDIPATDALTDKSDFLANISDKERITHYLVRQDRCRAAASDLMLKQFVGVPILRRNSDGQNIKPCHATNLFNVSHDEDYVVLVTSPIYSVGVDVMKVKLTNPNRTIDQMFDNLGSIFSSTEWRYINEITESRLDRFYHLWTAKEAYVKCLGTGLYTEPHLLETEVRPGSYPGSLDVKLVHKGKEASAGCFEVRIFTNLIPGYIVSVCLGPVSECDSSWTRHVMLPSPPNRVMHVIEFSSVSFLRSQDS